MKRKISRFFKSLQKAPERKHYLEFVTAALSIPVLLTVILVNLNALKANNTQNKPSPTPEVKEVIIHDTVPQQGVTPLPTDKPLCKKEVGPISITSPKEGATITDNPVNFIISYPDNGYCSVVWSYRINGGTWSEYSSNSPSVYNMPNGQVRFELRVQSTVSQDQNSLQRNFIYQGTTIAATPTPTSTPVPPTPTQ